VMLEASAVCVALLVCFLLREIAHRRDPME
jgi:hypothetical protein